jgi:hypothetical protein
MCRNLRWLRGGRKNHVVRKADLSEPNGLYFKESDFFDHL